MKELSKEALALVKKMQQNELDESIIYKKIAKFAKGEENKKKLEQQYKEYMEIYNKVVKKHTVNTTMNTSAGAFTQSSTDTTKVNAEMQQYNKQYKQ